jgi:hypothetical protein
MLGSHMCRCIHMVTYDENDDDDDNGGCGGSNKPTIELVLIVRLSVGVTVWPWKTLKKVPLLKLLTLVTKVVFSHLSPNFKQF